MYQVNLLPWRLRRQRQRYTFWLRCFVAQLLLVLATLTTAYFCCSTNRPSNGRYCRA